MLSPESKPTQYQLKKQAVFDALYKCCERNKKGQVSLSSVLQYISKEIGSNFKSSEYNVNDLNQKLQDKSEDGWLLFVELCEILNCWMDDISHLSQCSTRKINSDVVEYAHRKQNCQYSLPLCSPVAKNIALNDSMFENTICEVLFTKCEKCGRDENCCEWRNNEASREGKITRCYEQRLTELQNLLRQSEDCNSVIQLENESFRRNNSILQNKEQRWIAKEEELIEREQQLSSEITLLKEQNEEAEKEIKNLKQQLGRVKIENEKLVSENLLHEGRVADRARVGELLCEAKLQQSQMQIDLDSKEVLLAELDAKLEDLQQYNKVLEVQISEMQRSNSPVTSVEMHHEQSLGEEMIIADISDESSFKSSDMVCLDIPEENSLKAELDACGQWPVLVEHVAAQATPSVSTSATQTDGNLLACDIHQQNELENFNKLENNYFHHKDPCADQNSVVIEQAEKISAFSETELKIYEESEFSKQCSDNSKQLVTSQPKAHASIPFITENESCLQVPIMEENDQVQTTHQYQSTYEMELFIMVDALTQTEPFIKERKNETVVKEPDAHSPEKQCIPVNPSTSTLLLNNAAFGCIVPSGNRICRPSPGSTLATEYVHWKAAVNTFAQQTKLAGCHRFLCWIIQILFVIVAWYLIQELIQLHDGQMWCNLPSFRSELHRVLAQKMELYWPRGPPPQ